MNKRYLEIKKLIQENRPADHDRERSGRSRDVLWTGVSVFGEVRGAFTYCATKHNKKRIILPCLVGRIGRNHTLQ